MLRAPEAVIAGMYKFKGTHHDGAFVFRLLVSVLLAALVLGSVLVAADQFPKSGDNEQDETVTSTSAAIVTPIPIVPFLATYYAAPNGSPSGDGSIARPWDLRTALNQPSSLRPGDTILLRGGTYPGAFPSRLTGTGAAPITVRSAPNEWAVIDGSGTSSGHGLDVGGRYAVYRDFEVSTMAAGIGVNNDAPNTKIINLVIHDSYYDGLGWWIPSSDSEAYGNIIFNNGQDPNRDHGVYTQNQNGSKRLIDNVIVNNSTYQTQVYGSGDSYLRNYTIDGNNFYFGGDSISGDHASNIVIGTGAPGENIVFTNNYLYRQNAHNSGTNFSQGTSGNHDLIARNNYFADGGPTLRLGSWNNLNFTNNTLFGSSSGSMMDYSSSSGSISFDNNTYYALSSSPFNNNGSGQTFSQWRSSTGFDSASQFTSARPINRIWIRPNQYEPGRANVTIYNWQRLGTVDVNLTSVLSPGASYEVRNAQNYCDKNRHPACGDAPLTGVCPASPPCIVSIPTSGWTVADPVGSGLVTPPNTLPEFGVFIVRTTSTNSTPPPTQPPTLSPTRTPIATSIRSPLVTQTPGGATATRTGTPTRTSTPLPTQTPGGATATLTPGAPPFTDVNTTDYFYEAVTYLYHAGAVSGYSDNTFRPYNMTTRGQLCKIIVLGEEWEINTNGGPHFSDVSPANPFYDFIETAYNQGVISGYADGTFRWNVNISRGQLCKVVVLASGWPLDPSPEPDFSDVPPASPFYDYIETAYGRGIISGYSDGTFRPNNSAVRGQICKVFYQALFAGN